MNNRDMKTKEELINESGRVNGFKFEDYCKNGKQNNRKLNEPNPFKKKIYHLINGVEDEQLKKVMEIVFLMNHVDAHKDFLLKRVEEEPNYFRTLTNIEKCKARSFMEMSILDIPNVEFKINKMNKRDDRFWMATIEIKCGDLFLRGVVDYKRVKDLLKNKKLNETSEVEGIATLGGRELNKQQYFEFSLRNALNLLDDKTMELMTINNK